MSKDKFKAPIIEKRDDDSSMRPAIVVERGISSVNGDETSFGAPKVKRVEAITEGDEVIKVFEMKEPLTKIGKLVQGKIEKHKISRMQAALGRDVLERTISSFGL